MDRIESKYTVREGVESIRAKIHGRRRRMTGCADDDR